MTATAAVLADQAHYVYRVYDAKGLLYIGCTNDPDRRKREHARMLRRFGAVTWQVAGPYATRAAALKAEYDAIDQEWPRLNSRREHRRDAWLDGVRCAHQERVAS